MPGGLSPELSPVEYPDLGVAAAHSDLIGEERVETDGGDGLVTADEDILTTEICRTPGLLSQVEPADGPVLPSGEEGVGVPGDGDGLVHRPHVTVELTVGGVGLPQQVGVEEGPVPRTAHDLLVAGLGQELGREDVGSVRGEDLVNFPADKQSVPFRESLWVSPVVVRIGEDQFVVVRAGEEESAGGVPVESVDTACMDLQAGAELQSLQYFTTVWK